MSTILDQYYKKLFDIYFSPQGKIKVATGFHAKMEQINALLKNDVTSYIETILEFMIHCATVKVDFTSNNAKLSKVFSDWQENLNKKLNLDIPKGLRSFTEQYFRERWKSSLIAVRLKWGKVNGYWLPTIMYVLNGSDVYFKNETKDLNKNRYYLGRPQDRDQNILKSTSTDTYLIRKPYNQWYTLEPTPYLAKKGTLYHALFKTSVLNRQSDIIDTAFPYQFLLKVGTDETVRKNILFDESELNKLLEQFKDKKEKIDEHTFSKGLAGAFPHFVNFEEIMPDYKKATDEAILKNTDKNILASLGMIELKGFSSNREESILNPKVMVEEVIDAVKDYIEFLNEIVELIKEKNQDKYTMNDHVEVAPGIIEAFITDEMRTLIRSLYDRGIISYEDTLESTTPLNFKRQITKRDIERKDKLNIKMYPRLVQNMESQEADPYPQDDDVSDNKKKGSPEAKNFKNATLMKSVQDIPEDIRKELSEGLQEIFLSEFNIKFQECIDLDYDDYFKEKLAMEYAWEQTKIYLQAPYTNTNYPPQLKGLPVGARNIWIKTYNTVLEETNNENTARKAAWANVKNKYKKIDNKWVKK